MAHKERCEVEAREQKKTRNDGSSCWRHTKKTLGFQKTQEREGALAGEKGGFEVREQVSRKKMDVLGGGTKERDVVSAREKD